MKKSMLFFLFMMCATVALMVGVAAGPPAADYVGVQKCKLCHSTKALGGEQYKIWEKSRHARALETLKEAGEAKNPRCLKCHTTGEGMPGVQCEACHGPGSGYRSPKIMSKKAFREDPAAARKAAVAAGLVMPPTEDVCRGCHNEESPKFKGFDFTTYKEKIKHWD